MDCFGGQDLSLCLVIFPFFRGESIVGVDGGMLILTLTTDQSKKILQCSLTNVKLKVHTIAYYAAHKAIPVMAIMSV